MGAVMAGGDRAYKRLSAGFLHTCALDVAGAAFCWGSNDYDQLGAPTSTQCGGRPCSRTPIAVSGGLRFTTIASGWVSNCGIAADGRTYCWGGGAYSGKGYLGDGTLQRTPTPVRVHADSLFVSVTLGDGHACALTRSGVAFCWGQNNLGQLGDGTTEDRATPVPVATPLRFRELSAGAYHVCGITTDGVGACWGDNRWGELGAGDVAYNALSAAARTPVTIGDGLALRTIAAGWEHTCALAITGAALCWGRNEDAHQLGDDSDVTHRGTPAAISGSNEFVNLSAGALATCAVTADGGTYCWGGNYYGTLGNGETAAKGVAHPVRAQGGPFEAVAIGQAHACGIQADGRLWCWGDQSAGQF